MLDVDNKKQVLLKRLKNSKFQAEKDFLCAMAYPVIEEKRNINPRAIGAFTARAVTYVPGTPQRKSQTALHSMLINAIGMGAITREPLAAFAQEKREPSASAEVSAKAEGSLFSCGCIV